MDASVIGLVRWREIKEGGEGESDIYMCIYYRGK